MRENDKVYLDRQTRILLLSILKKGYCDNDDYIKLSNAGLVEQVVIFKIPDNGRD